MRISVSKLKLFKACRRAYYFRYVENLQPIEKAEALQIGSNYHELIEWLNDHGTLDGVEEDNSKELAMASAYWKYIYPKFKVKSSEDWFEYDLGNGNKLVGITDGIAEDGSLVEHKTVGSDITEQYEYNLLWDEQILGYMLAKGSRKMYYTVCRKPTIRQKQNETDEEFFRRMVEWYDEDTDSKIRLLEIHRTDEEVAEFSNSLYIMISEMEEAEQYEDRLYRNCGWCNVWGRRCEYSSICLNYNPDETYVEFEKRKESR